MATISGLIVALEGIDGAGKSSQCQLVAEKLRSRGVSVSTPSSDPQRPLRRAYKNLIDHDEGFPDARTSVLLGLADFAYVKQLTDDEGEADVVLLDRYAYSTCADALALGMQPEQVLPLLRLFTPPDMAILIDVRPQAAIARKDGKCSVAEAGGPQFLADFSTLPDSFVAYQTVVRQAFIRLLSEHHGQHGFEIVQGEKNIGDLSDDISEVVCRELESRRLQEPVGA